MKLISITHEPNAERILYDLLAERTAVQSISHERMPTFAEHCSFVRDHPYSHWYLIEDDLEELIGAIYLSKRDEIGIALFERFTGKGWGPAAVNMLMDKHRRRRYLANVAPGNEASRKMWQKMCFKHIQDTYALATG